MDIHSFCLHYLSAVTNDSGMDVDSIHDRMIKVVQFQRSHSVTYS